MQQRQKAAKTEESLGRIERGFRTQRLDSKHEGARVHPQIKYVKGKASIKESVTHRCFESQKDEEGYSRAEKTCRFRASERTAPSRALPGWSRPTFACYIPAAHQIGLKRILASTASSWLAATPGVNRVWKRLETTGRVCICLHKYTRHVESRRLPAEVMPHYLALADRAKGSAQANCSCERQGCPDV